MLPVLLACSPGTPPPPAAPEPVGEGSVAPVPRAATADGRSLRVPTDAGELTVHAVHHGTMVLSLGSTTVWVDPWSQGDLTGHPPADVLLITDIHPDHLDADAIAKVTTDSTIVVAPKAVDDALEHPVAHVLANGESVTVAGIGITATPMYNLVRGPEEGGLFHDPGRGNGYLLEVGGRRLYIAGDTECTPEMKALKQIDVAFVPMNLPYTMPPDEAAACVAAFAPRLAVPYHYRGSDLAVFDAGLVGTGVDVQRLAFYGE